MTKESKENTLNTSNFIDIIVKAASVFVSTIGILYLIGWLYLFSYYDVFHASWLLSLVPKLNLLLYSFAPAFFLTVFGAFIISFLFESPRIILKDWTILGWFFFLSAFGALAKWLEWDLPVWVGSTAYGIAGLGFLVLSGFILLRLRTNWRIESKSVRIRLVTGMILAAVILLPLMIGRCIGLKDAHPKSTKLPIINMRKDSIDGKLRAVYISRDRVYAVQLLDTGPKPIKILQWKEIMEVKGFPDD